MKIHKTAIVNKGAKLGRGVEIGPWCIIENNVTIGDNTKIWQNVYITSGTKIGKNNNIHMGGVLGHEPQHLSYKGEKTGLTIGDGNIIREYVSIHRSFTKGQSTIIGDRNFFMGFAHIAHDCKIGNGVIICNSALLGGHVEVEDKVFIGGGAGIHQFSRIGTLAMLGGFARVTKDVVPYMLADGSYSEIYGINIVGIRRAELDKKATRQIKEAYKILYRSGLNTTNALKKIRNLKDLTKEVLHIVEFAEKAKRGICKHRNKIVLDETDAV